jgi:enamine deaminase RidA (YjgF/YER057c/UK114 family)
MNNQTNIEDVGGMNEVWLEWMRGVAAPARATVGTTALVSPKWKIEVIITAAVYSHRDNSPQLAD